MTQDVENASPGATPPGINVITASSSNSPSTLEAALAWAARGFRVFPIAKGTKDDFIVKNWATEASSDPMMIRAWWRINGVEQNYNIGCLTTGMVVVDIDVKNGKLGPQSFDSLGLEMSSLVVQTWSGGFHVYYDWPSCSNRADLLGPGSGLDIRSYNGYVLAPGSCVEGKFYKVFRDGDMELLPDRLAEMLSPPTRKRSKEERGESNDSPDAIAQAIFYLLEQAPISIVGKAGNDTAYKVACKLTSDFGLSEDKAIDLLIEHWNPRCLPPWSERELEGLVDHSEKYAKGDKGAETIAAMMGGDAESIGAFIESIIGDDTDEPEVSDEWPELKPLKSSLPDVEPFIPDLLPAALRNFVVDEAERKQCPPDFIAVMAMAGLAGLAGNAIRIQPMINDTGLQVVPVLWAAAVGDPSSGKSPALTAALGPLKKLERELISQWTVDSREAKRKCELKKVQSATYRRKAAQKFDVDEEESAENLFDQAFEAEKEEEKFPCPRLIVNDSTIEKLGEIQAENPGGLLLERDELNGWLSNLADEKRLGERAFYLQCFNGGSYVCDRIGRGTIPIEKCTLSVVGGIQPARLAPIVAGARSGSSDDGLIQRFQLAIWPNIPEEWTDVDRAPDEAAAEDYRAAFRKLFDFRRAQIDAGNTAVFKFTTESQSLFKPWREGILCEARGGTFPPIMQAHLLKMVNTIVTMALLFQIVGSEEIDEPFQIGVEATRRAIRWSKYLRSHAGRIFSLGDQVGEADMQIIFQRRRDLPERFTVREVVRKGWLGLRDNDTVIRVLGGLVDAGYLKRQVIEGNGRPSFRYAWNPALNGLKH